MGDARHEPPTHSCNSHLLQAMLCPTVGLGGANAWFKVRSTEIRQQSDWGTVYCNQPNSSFYGHTGENEQLGFLPALVYHSISLGISHLILSDIFSLCITWKVAKFAAIFSSPACIFVGCPSVSLTKTLKCSYFLEMLDMEFLGWKC